MSTTVNTPFELLFDQLRDIHSAAVQLRKSLPVLVELSSSEDLRDLIAYHAEQNLDQIVQINTIFERYGESPGNDKCKAMAGLIEGGTAHLNDVRSPHTRDLMMIAHCLRIEYYKMAAYEITTLLSERLGLMREPETLSGMLAEEKEIASSLTLLEPELFEIAYLST